MYATYTYKAGSTAANILADVVKLLTGTTTIGALSTDCTALECLTTYSPAGWTLHDAAAGTNLQVLSAPWHTDNGTGYNYIGIDVNTAGYIGVRVYEGWNASTHVALNEAYSTGYATLHQRLNTASGGMLYISSNAGHSCMMYSYQAASWGSATYSAPTGFTERQRMALWDTNSNAYPVGVLTVAGNTLNYLVGGSTSYVPRYVNNLGADVTGISAVIGLSSTIYGTSMTDTPSVTLPAANKVLAHSLLPIIISNKSTLGLMGDISKYSYVYALTNGAGSILDELTANSETYAVWAQSGTSRFAVRKG